MAVEWTFQNLFVKLSSLLNGPLVPRHFDRKNPPPPGGFSIYYVPWSRAVCKRFHDEIRPSHIVVKSLTHGSWSGNIVNRKPTGGGFCRSTLSRSGVIWVFATLKSLLFRPLSSELSFTKKFWKVHSTAIWHSQFSIAPCSYYRVVTSLKSQLTTGWRRPIWHLIFTRHFSQKCPITSWLWECLIFIGQFAQKSLIICGYFVEKDKLRHPMGLRHPVAYQSGTPGDSLSC